MDKAIKIVLVVFLVAAACFYGIIEGVRDKIAGSIGLSSAAIAEQNKGNKVDEKETYGNNVKHNSHKDFWENEEYKITNYFFVLKDDDINGTEEDGNYKNGIRPDLIDIGSVDMDRVGLDSLMLKKMKVVYTASKTADGGVVLAELADKIYGEDKDGKDGPDLVDREIMKVTDTEKYCEQYKKEFNITDDLAEKLIKQYEIKATEPAPWNPDTELNYIPGFDLKPEESEGEEDEEEAKGKIFWFQDNAGDIDSTKPGAYYLGAYGVINVTTDIDEDTAEDKDEDGTKGELIYRYRYPVVENGFNGMFDQYKQLMREGNEDEAEKIKKEILKSGQMNKDGTVNLYTITTKYQKFEYSFEGSVESSDLVFLDAELGEQTVDLEDLLEFTKIQISVELTSDLLDLTGSHEFANLFMDYALNKTEVEIKAYSQVDKTMDFKTDEYNIAKNVEMIVADFKDVDRLNTYISTIASKGINLYDFLDLTQQKKDTSDDKLKDLKDKRNDIQNDLNNATVQYSNALSAGNTALANTWRNKMTQLQGQLGTSNTALNTEKGNNDILKETLKLYKKIANSMKIDTTNPVSAISEIIGPIAETTIDVTDVTTWVPVVEKATTWYAKVEYEKPTVEPEYTVNVGGSKNFVDEAGYNSYNAGGYRTSENISGTSPDKTIKPAVRTDSASRDAWGSFSETIPTGSNWIDLTVNKLAEKISGSSFSEKSDYVSVTYTKTDQKTYTGESSFIKRIIPSNIEKDLGEDKDERIKQFLALLKNEEGTIECGLTKQQFDPDGKVVEYNDIYQGGAKVGDLLENCAEMLFKLLNDSDRTQCLVKVFQYILYIYSGNDYGTTEYSQLANVFQLAKFNGFAGGNGNVTSSGITGNSTSYWWPVAPDASGKPASTNVTSTYGWRSATNSFHHGIDISVPRGTKIIAVKGGTVERVVNGYGEGKFDKSYRDQANYVIIRHDDGTSSRYWHLQEGTVKVGQRVEQGDVIRSFWKLWLYFWTSLTF